MVLLPQLGGLGFQRDVLASEQLNLECGVAGEHLVAPSIEPDAVRVLGQRLGQSEITLFFLRFDFLDELEVGRFSGLVLGLAGHRDIAFGTFLGNRGAEFLSEGHSPGFSSVGTNLRGVWMEIFSNIDRRADDAGNWSKIPARLLGLGQARHRAAREN